MNRQEIIEAYNLPRILQIDAFKDAYRAVRALVGNKDRAYMRLVRGQTYRRTVKKPEVSGAASFETGSETG